MAFVVGLVAAPVLRGQIAHYAVPDGVAWRTACDGCGKPLGVLLSPTGWCGECGTRVGPPLGSVELVAAAALAILIVRLDGVALLPLLAMCWLALIGTVLAFVDVAVHRLPNRLNAAAAIGVIGLLAIAAVDEGRPGRLVWAVVCGLCSAAAYLVLVFLGPMGMGDVKLAVALGTMLGWWGGLVTLLGIAAGFVVYGVLAVALLTARRVGRGDQLPHGPAMLIGALGTIAILAG